MFIFKFSFPNTWFSPSIQKSFYTTFWREIRNIEYSGGDNELHLSNAVKNFKFSKGYGQLK